MKKFRELPPKSLAAMIAVRGLPESPLYEGDDQKVIDIALRDLEMYKKAGVQSIVLENDFDLPYMRPPLPKTAIKLMTAIANKVRSEFDGPIGIQMLEAANEASLEIAHEADLDYIRVEGFVFAHVGTSGIIEGCAAKLLRKRKILNAEHIKVFADVKKKHCAHSLTSDLDITDEVKQAEFCLVDGIIITSKFTGIAPSQNDFIKVREVTKLPLLVGSGMTPENISEFLPLADIFIVGSVFRKDGKFLGETEPERVSKFMKIFNKERAKYL
jgi:hypothetical protein